MKKIARTIKLIFKFILLHFYSTYWGVGVGVPVGGGGVPVGGGGGGPDHLKISSLIAVFPSKIDSGSFTDIDVRSADLAATIKKHIMK